METQNGENDKHLTTYYQQNTQTTNSDAAHTEKFDPRSDTSSTFQTNTTGISSTDQGSGRSSVGIKSRKSSKEVRRAASTSLRRGTAMLLIHTLPEEARNYMEDRAAMLTGLSAILVLLLAFIGLIFFYGRCSNSTVLVDVPGPHHKDCQPQLTINNQLSTIDRLGNWSIDPSFRPAEGLWKVLYADGYSNSEAGFRANLKDVFSQLQVLLNGLNGRRWYEVMQALHYSNVTAKGTSGYMLLRPNLQLEVLVGNKITDWSQLRDMSQYIKQDLPRSDATLREMAVSRWAENCTGTIIMHGYDHLQVRGKRAFSVVDKSRDFRGSQGQLAYTRLQPPRCAPTEVKMSDNLFSLDVPFLRDIVNYPGRQNTWDLQWDISQVFPLDWCNRNWQRCIESLCPDVPQDGSNKPLTGAFTACVQARLLELGSSERYPSTYSRQIDRIGFLWQPMNNPTGRTYLVVPELVPDYECVTCDGQSKAAGVDCQSFLGIAMHYYEYELQDGDARYHITMEYNLQLDGVINSDMARPTMQCDTSSLQMRVDPDTLQRTVETPFDLTKGVQRCTLQICKSPLERLSLSFSNVILLYTCFSVMVVMLVMYVNGRKAEEHRRAVKSGRGSGVMVAKTVRVEEVPPYDERRVILSTV